MKKYVDIKIEIPSKARSFAERPYLEHIEFVDYCKANMVDCSKNHLEILEREGLLYPCYRIICPEEYLIKKNENPERWESDDSCQPLYELEKDISVFSEPQSESFKKALKSGHPLTQAIEESNQFIIQPDKDNFIKWDQYNICVKNRYNQEITTSKARHFYSIWKIILIHEINQKNTIVENKVAGTRNGWRVIKKDTIPSALYGFEKYFTTLMSYSFKRKLLIINYHYNIENNNSNLTFLNNNIQDNANFHFLKHSLVEWVKLLRKIIEIHEEYEKKRNFILSNEARRFAIKLIDMLMLANDYSLNDIYDIYLGEFKKAVGLGTDKNNILIIPYKIQNMFPTLDWIINRERIWDILKVEIDGFNDYFSDNDKFPEIILSEIKKEFESNPQGTIILAILNMQKFLKDTEKDEEILLRDEDLCGGLRNLAVTVEAHGKNMIGDKDFGSMLQRLYSDYYKISKKIGDKITSAKSIKEFERKLGLIEKTTIVTEDERYGKHLFIAHLSRNFLMHTTGLSGSSLQKHLISIYRSLITTFLVIFAKYKNV
ncbi:MAG: hypothetical protein HQ591_05645 [candidate division Zixibacteria bacterium]|nr:hypothetical protein [Candidatus Tariuqbacter arcticus]